MYTNTLTQIQRKYGQTIFFADFLQTTDAFCLYSLFMLFLERLVWGFDFDKSQIET